MNEVFLSVTGEHSSTPVSEHLLVILGASLLAWYLQYLWRRRKLYCYSRSVPGPLSFPVIGSALQFIGNSNDMFTNIMNACYEYDGIFHFWFGPKLFYVISDPKYYEILLPNYLKKDQLYRHGSAAVGHGLVTAPVDIWKKHRKIIMPTFNQKILNGYLSIISEQSEILVQQMEKLTGTEFDIFTLISKCTLDIICETAMGVKVNAQINNNTPLATWVDRIMEIIFLKISVLWYQVDAIFHLTPTARDFLRNIKNLHEFSEKIIREKKQIFNESRKKNINTSQVPSERGVKRRTFLDHLIEITDDENIFTEQELRDEVNTFIIAGTDTTAISSSFVLLMLALHTDMQEKVYQEIIEVVGLDRAIQPEDLTHLKYMKRFIKETLRLFPVTPFISRDIVEDVNLGEYMVPGGITVLFCLLRTHTNEKYWPDPFKFNPDRFLPEEISKRKSCTYLPFSYGPRHCAGMRHAMMVMKVVVTIVLRKFKIRTPYKSLQDIKLKAKVFLRCKDGYKVSLEPR